MMQTGQLNMYVINYIVVFINVNAICNLICLLHKVNYKLSHFIICGY